MPHGRRNGKGKNKGKGNCPSKNIGNNQAGKRWNQDEAEHFPYKFHRCEEDGVKAALCTKRKAKAGGKKGVYRLEGEEGEEAGVDGT